MLGDLSTLTWASQQELNEAVVSYSGMSDFASVETEPMHLDGRRLVEQLRDAAPFVVRVRGEYLGVVECRGASGSWSGNGFGYCADRSGEDRRWRRSTAARAEADATQGADFRWRAQRKSHQSP